MELAVSNLPSRQCPWALLVSNGHYFLLSVPSSLTASFRGLGHQPALSSTLAKCPLVHPWAQRGHCQHLTSKSGTGCGLFQGGVPVRRGAPLRSYFAECFFPWTHVDLRLLFSLCY